MNYVPTESPMDYTALSTIMTFDECETQSCVNITIVDDLALEIVESLRITLNSTADLDGRITLDPVDGIIEIVDNDGAYIMTCYTNTS